MERKTIIIVFFVLLFCYSLKSQSNNYCEILHTALNNKFCNNKYKILTVDFSESKQYSENLQIHFPEKDVFEIVNKMDDTKVTDFNFECKIKVLNFISEKKFYTILNKNNKRKCRKLKKNNELRTKKNCDIYTTSPIIIYKEFAIIEISQTYSSMDSVTYGLLLEKKNNIWIVIDILYSAAS